MKNRLMQITVYSTVPERLIASVVIVMFVYNNLGHVHNRAEQTGATIEIYFQMKRVLLCMGEPGNDKRVEKGSGFSDFHLQRANILKDSSGFSDCKGASKAAQ